MKRVLALILGFSAAILGAQTPTTIQVLTSPGGVQYLADSGGMTLYYYTKDANGQSACYGGCASAWPVFYADTVTVPDTLTSSDFGTITRADGTQQATFKGWPLYYWAKDTKRGDTTGQAVGKVWYMIDPAKFPPS